MHHPLTAHNRRSWIAAGIALLLFILVLSIWLPPNLPLLSQHATQAQNQTGSTLLNLSPADAARRAAIAKLGFIDAQSRVNAADSYSRAMALYNQLTDSEKNALKDWRTKLDPQSAEALFEKLQPILGLLRTARNADYVDWGTDPLMPDAREARFNAMQYLSQVAQWAANYEFQADPADALQDLAAAEALDRNAAGALGGFRLYSDLRAPSLQIIAQNVDALPAGQISNLDFITNPAAIIQASQNIINAQAASMQSVLDQFADPATRSQATQVIQDVLIPYMDLSTNVSGAIPLIQRIAQTDQQFANTFSEPEDQFVQWVSQVQSDAASPPLPAFVLPTIEDQRTILESSEIQAAMVTAGIALQQGSQSQFQSILDPVTGQPFTVTQTPNGFQLSSSIKFADGPVTLTFGPPPLVP
jgi:hypothetical protein